MRTVRCSGRLIGRVVCPGGGLPRGVHLPPCGQTDTCENITFPQLLLRTVMKARNTPLQSSSTESVALKES